MAVRQRTRCHCVAASRWQCSAINRMDAMAQNTETPRAHPARHRVDRRTVDLSAYPDLVVIYLGMRMNSLRGLWTMFRIGPQIRQSVAAKPDGLLLHEDLMYSL